MTKGGVRGPVTASDTDSKRLKGRRTKEVGSMCSWKGEVESWASRRIRGSQGYQIGKKMFKDTGGEEDGNKGKC